VAGEDHLREWVAAVKPLPLLLALVLGVGIGLAISHLNSEEPESRRVDAPPGGTAADVPVIVFKTDPPTPAREVAPPRPSELGSAPAGITPPPASLASGQVSSPIDAGPVFNQQFATAEKQGISDGMLEAHRALEREPRDDSWSYPLEAEIENSLVSDTSMGNFRKEHLECRSTMCEIRLSAEGGAQIEALRQWTSDIQKFPWAARMQLSSSSTVSSDERMDALMIVSRPPAPAEAD
jgi:hypothetical protein